MSESIETETTCSNWGVWRVDDQYIAAESEEAAVRHWYGDDPDEGVDVEEGGLDEFFDNSELERHERHSGDRTMKEQAEILIAGGKQIPFSFAVAFDY